MVHDAVRTMLSALCKGPNKCCMTLTVPVLVDPCHATALLPALLHDRESALNPQGAVTCCGIKTELTRVLASYLIVSEDLPIDVLA